jgi:dienelactone hydrolase
MKSKIVRRGFVFGLCSLALLSIFPDLMLFAADHKNIKTGYSKQTLKNPRATGSSSLKTLIWYPKRQGSDQLAKKPRAGFPVIVFLHGFGGPAFVYPVLGRTLASHGYIVVINNTAIVNPSLQRKDAVSIFHALKVLNSNPQSRWYQSMDLQNVGLAGHSMGAGTTAHTLAANPGYKAGFCFAPWPGGKPFTDTAPQIRVPLGIVHGEGDTALPWKETAKTLFDSLPSESADSFLYLLNSKCTHQNVARSIYWANDKDKMVFQTTTELCLSYFDKHLKQNQAPLNSILLESSPNAILTKIYRK